MNSFITYFAICCLAWTAKAKPGYGHQDIMGVPDLQSYAAIQYPKYQLLDLGEYSTGHIPATEIHETKHITVKDPQPYPVKVPVPHPYPVPVAKPYPVVETKYVKIPQPVPYEVTKNVPVPVEVPKPYPVPVQIGGGHDGGLSSYGGGAGGGFGDLHGAGSGQSYGVQETFGGSFGPEAESAAAPQESGYGDQGNESGH